MPLKPNTGSGFREIEKWNRLLMEDVLQVHHRHVVFTIDEGL